MALLNFLHQEPPDGWKYLQRDTRVWIRAELWSELVDAVIAHRQHKGLTPIDRETVELEVQRQLCAGAGNGVCHAEPGENYAPFHDLSRGLTLNRIADFSAALMTWLKDGMKFVPKEESARRAEICRGCPFNKSPSACVCTTFFKAIDAIIPADRSEGGISICSLCGCSLRAKVLAPLEVAKEGNPENLRLPDYCWQK